MTSSTPDSHVPPTRRPRRRITVAALVMSAGLLAACGGGSAASITTASPVATTALVKPPVLPLQGCNYVINGSVPAGASGGTQPPFTLSGPDAAGTTALRDIEAHGGTGLVNGYTLPPGVKLFAGPDAAAVPVATVPDARSLFIADPVLWTTNSGAQWLASFVACGGPGLYWIDVAQIGWVSKNVGTQVTSSIASLKAAAAYPASGTASALPITIDHHQQFAWVNPAVTFAIGRGQYLGF